MTSSSNEDIMNVEILKRKGEHLQFKSIKMCKKKSKN